MNSATFTAVLGVASHAVPAIWAFAAFYLVWGTERCAPVGYPVGMGFVAGLLWLGKNEVPVVLANYGVTPELVSALLLLAAAGLAVELVALTISNYDLGHRSKLAARLATRFKAAMPTMYNGRRDLDDTDAEPPNFVNGAFERLRWFLPPYTTDKNRADDHDDRDH